VPIEIERSLEKLDAILIDDDMLIHAVWAQMAKDKDKSLRCYSSVTEFMSAATGFDLDTPIYIDSSLSAGERGEVRAKEIFDLGFKCIYLATGYEASTFAPVEWIKGVVGKDGPF